MFELIDALKDLKAAAERRDWPAVVELSGKVLTLTAGLWRAWSGPQAVAVSSDQQAQLLAAADELEAFCTQASGEAVTSSVAGLNPVLIVELIGLIVRLVREIRG